MRGASGAQIHDDTKLPALTGLRFIAASAVLISHFDHRSIISVPTALVDFLDGGRTAVSLFFVLSGFILAYNYADMSGRSDRIKFYASRVARIYPVTLLALGIGAAGMLYAVLTPDSGALLEWYALKDANLFNVCGSFIAQLTVTTGWLPTASLNQPWNSPAWSIACEAFFYALFPLLILGLRQLSRWRIVLVLIGSFVLQCLIIWAARAFAPAGQKGFLVSQFPLTHLFEFIVGIAAAVFFLRGGAEWLRGGATRSLLLASSLIPLTLLAYFRPVDPAYLLMSPLFAVLILALAVPGRRPSVLAWGPLVLLGEASFSLYMIHVPLMNLFSIVQPSEIAGWLLVALVICLSIIVFKYVETPARFGVRGAILRRVLPSEGMAAGADGKGFMLRHGPAVRNVALISLLAVAAGGVSAVALQGPRSAPPAVSEKVARYSPSPLPTATPRPSLAQALAPLTRKPTQVWTLTVLGDSTGNEPGEWVQLVASDLGRITGRPVVMHYWDQMKNSYLPPKPAGDGGNAPIHVWDGSAAGRGADYSREHLTALMPSKSDLVILNHGHNHQTASAVVPSFRSLLFTVDLRHGPVAGFVTVQNEWKIPTASSTAVQAETKRAFTGSEYGVIDVMTAFKSAPDKDELLMDGFNPSPVGSRLWADTVLKSLGY